MRPRISIKGFVCLSVRWSVCRSVGWSASNGLSAELEIGIKIPARILFSKVNHERKFELQKSYIAACLLAMGSNLRTSLFEQRCV